MNADMSFDEFFAEYRPIPSWHGSFFEVDGVCYGSDNIPGPYNEPDMWKHVWVVHEWPGRASTADLRIFAMPYQHRFSITATEEGAYTLGYLVTTKPWDDDDKVIYVQDEKPAKKRSKKSKRKER